MEKTPFNLVEEGKNPSVLEMLEASTEKFPQTPAMIYLGKSFSYAELIESISRFSGGLSSLGVKKGEKVIIYLPNTPQFVIAYYAILRIGAIPVPVSPTYTPTEIGYISRDCGARTIICLRTNFGYVKEVLPQSELKTIIYTDLIEMLPLWKKVVGYGFDKVPRGKIEKGRDVHRFSDLLKHPPTPQTEDVSEWKDEDVCRILYTGGTTGVPKGVVVCRSRLYFEAVELAEVGMGTEIAKGNSKIVMVLPLFHLLGQGVLGGLIFGFGNTVILMPNPQVDAILECIQRYCVDLFLGVPALYRSILESQRLDQYDLKSLRYCWSGGDVLPNEIFKRWESKFDMPLHQLYGSTEGGLHCATSLSEKPKLGSVGSIVTVGKRKFKLVNPDTLDSVPEGTPGELLISGPLFLNYYLNKPEETAETFVDLDGDVYYRTKDMLMVKEGQFFFVDRSADVIKHKGFRVSASEIEAALQDHEAVVAACAVGVPDPKVGERIKAFVVIKEDARGVSAQDLIRWCRERLAPYKIPQYIEFRDMLPKSKVGKLLRRDMRDEERRKITEKK